MPHKYIVYTSLPRDFDPDIEGLTLDSIAETCPGYLKHSIPFTRNLTQIWITLDHPINEKSRNWLIGQLEAEFEDCGDEDLIVLDIKKYKG